MPTASSARQRRHFIVLCLVLAGILYRGLIPAGFMPALDETANRGALLVFCHHGETGPHKDGDNRYGSVSIDQCPFGAAAGPAAPTVKLAFVFLPGLADVQPDWSTTGNDGTSLHLQPPARGPPIFS